MKKKMFILTCGISLFLVSILSSCEDKTGKANTNKAWDNLVACLVPCDSLSQKYFQAYVDERNRCERNYYRDLNSCKGVADFRCRDSLFTILVQCSEATIRIYDLRTEEIKKCKAACVDEFIKTAGIKPSPTLNPR